MNNNSNIEATSTSFTNRNLFYSTTGLYTNIMKYCSKHLSTLFRVFKQWGCLTFRFSDRWVGVAKEKFFILEGFIKFRCLWVLLINIQTCITALTVYFPQQNNNTTTLQLSQGAYFINNKYRQFIEHTLY